MIAVTLELAKGEWVEEKWKPVSEALEGGNVLVIYNAMCDYEEDDVDGLPVTHMKVFIQ